MNGLKLLSLSLVFGLGMIAQPSFADETSTTSVEVSTPAGSSSQASTYKATSGPEGAKVSATKEHTIQNADGSFASGKTHESHTLDALGSRDHKTSEHTTITPDGSSATEKHETEKTQSY